MSNISHPFGKSPAANKEASERLNKAIRHMAVTEHFGTAPQTFIEHFGDGKTLGHKRAKYLNPEVQAHAAKLKADADRAKAQKQGKGSAKRHPVKVAA